MLLLSTTVLLKGKQNKGRRNSKKNIGRRNNKQRLVWNGAALQNPFVEQPNQKQGGMQNLMRERGSCQLTKRKWKEVWICVARDRERRRGISNA
jgi:hypothetical protein